MISSISLFPVSSLAGIDVEHVLPALRDTFHGSPGEISAGTTII